MSQVITLTGPAVVRPAQTSATLTVLRVTYSNARRVAFAHVREVGTVVLWEGDAYDAAGQWTDADVETRLRELFPATS